MPQPVPTPDRQELFKDARSLPTPPAIVMQIVQLLSDENVAVEAVAGSVALDAALAGKVLRTVNSAAFSPAARVTRLDRAISFLGFGPFRSLLMGTAMSDLVPASGNAVATEIRRRSVINATLSKAFAEEVDVKISEEAFLGGLLGSLGHLVLARKAPTTHAYLCDQAGGWSVAPDEFALLGYTMDDVTSDLLTQWGMPDMIPEAIMLRSEARVDWSPRRATGDLVTSLRLGLMAERVLCNADAATALADLLTFGRQVLGLNLLRVSEILVATEPLVADLARSMKFDVPEHTHEAILEEALETLEARYTQSQAQAGPPPQTAPNRV